jgi:hypothetical protein
MIFNAPAFRGASNVDSQIVSRAAHDNLTKLAFQFMASCLKGHFEVLLYYLINPKNQPQTKKPLNRISLTTNNVCNVKLITKQQGA